LRRKIACPQAGFDELENTVVIPVPVVAGKPRITTASPERSNEVAAAEAQATEETRNDFLTWFSAAKDFLCQGVPRGDACNVCHLHSNPIGPCTSRSAFYLPAVATPNQISTIMQRPKPTESPTHAIQGSV
jgi:hypothetical protein